MSTDYERGYQAGYHKRIRENVQRPKARPQKPRPVNRNPVLEKAYQDCVDAVDECHRLEAEYGLPTWAEYYDAKAHRIVEMPMSEWPAPYAEARAKWNELRTLRDYLYQHGAEGQAAEEATHESV